MGRPELLDLSVEVLTEDEPYQVRFAIFQLIGKVETVICLFLYPGVCLHFVHGLLRSVQILRVFFAVFLQQTVHPKRKHEHPFIPVNQLHEIFVILKMVLAVFLSLIPGCLLFAMLFVKPLYIFVILFWTLHHFLLLVQQLQLLVA